jgi:hypothetical protein
MSSRSSRSASGPSDVGTRIGAALLIVVSVFLMTGIQISGVFGYADIAVDYTVVAPDGSLVPVITD